MMMTMTNDKVEKTKLYCYFYSVLIGCLEKTEKGYVYTSNYLPDNAHAEEWVRISGQRPEFRFSGHSRQRDIIFHQTKTSRTAYLM